MHLEAFNVGDQPTERDARTRELAGEAEGGEPRARSLARVAAVWRGDPPLDDGQPTIFQQRVMNSVSSRLANRDDSPCTERRLERRLERSLGAGRMQPHDVAHLHIGGRPAVVAARLAHDDLVAGRDGERRVVVHHETAERGGHARRRQGEERDDIDLQAAAIGLCGEDSVAVLQGIHPRELKLRIGRAPDS